jgi:hypothetical protein
VKDIYLGDGKHITAVLTVSDDENDYSIRVGERTYFFEFDAMWGPLFVGARGHEIDNSRVQQSAFRAVSIWARQGKRTRPLGKYLQAIWDEPPKITHTYVRQGRSRLIIKTDTPEGCDHDFSEEVFVLAQGTSAGTAETERLGAEPAGPVGNADAPEPSQESQP